MLILLIAFSATGLLAAGLALPLLAGKIPPNRFYGFRTPSTLDDEDLWYAANKASAKILLAWGLVCAVLAIGTYFVPEIGENLYLAWNLGALIGGAFAVVILSFLSLRRLQRAR